MLHYKSALYQTLETLFRLSLLVGDASLQVSPVSDPGNTLPSPFL